MSKGRFDLEQEIMDCWNVTKDVNDVYEFVDDPFFKGMDPKHSDKLMNLLLGISELYEVKFNKLWNTFEAVLEKEGFKHKPSMLEYRTVSRVELINNEGRKYVNHEIENVGISFQDDGRTLKVFVTEKANEPDVDNQS